MSDPIRVPLGEGAYARTFGQLPEIRLENRFLEANPTTEEGFSLLSRPGSGAASLIVPSGAPYRALFSQEGVFDGDLFGVCTNASAGRLFRTALGDSPQIISNAADVLSDISFAAATGLYYEYLFVASDGLLKFYEGESYARASIRNALDEAAAQVFRIGNVYYAWRNGGSVDAGTPDGTSSNPWLVDHQAGVVTNDPEENAQAFEALARAINADGTPGTDYSTELTTRNPLVRAETPFITEGIGPRNEIPLVARASGTAGNSIILEQVSGDPVSLINASGTTAGPDSITFEGGGVHALEEVTVPEGVEISHVVALSGFVIAVERDSHRFFYIYPGETEIETLNFESAESEPDEIVDAVQAGDLVWLLGRSSVEAWYASGAADRPIQRLSGSAFRIGAVPGTASVLQGVPIFVGTDNLVYALEGSPQRISDHGIEERLRVSGLLEKRAWSFSLDGHFFYVLSIEEQGTFVYDATTKRWAHWYTTAETPFWNLVEGATWRTFILGIDWAGDGVWDIEPDGTTDPSSAAIPRVVTGLLPWRQRGRARNSFVRLYASPGAAGSPVLSLRFSDDGGNTWSSTFTRTLTSDADQELYFSSLGMVGVPGRLWELSDTGGLVRIDGLYAQLD